MIKSGVFKFGMTSTRSLKSHFSLTNVLILLLTLLMLYNSDLKEKYYFPLYDFTSDFFVIHLLHNRTFLRLFVILSLKQDQRSFTNKLGNRWREVFCSILGFLGNFNPQVCSQPQKYHKVS